MDPDQVKIILSCYRPNGQDAADPAFAEALAAVGRDPELQAWFEEQQKLDAIIARKIDQSNVPEDLLQSIVTGHSSEPRIHRLSRIRTLALAACILFALGLAMIIWLSQSRSSQPTSPLTAFQNDMSEFLNVFPRLDLETEHLDKVQQWLTQYPSLKSSDIPDGLKKFPSIGCREIKWGNKKIALVCFMVNGEVVHLFLLNPSQWPQTHVESDTLYARTGSWNSATWQAQNTLFLALTQGDEALLRKVL